MIRKFFIAMTLPVFLLVLNGCASTKVNKEADLQIQGLKNQIALLETQLTAKDNEISSLKGELDTARSQDLVMPESSMEMMSKESTAVSMSSRDQGKKKRPQKPSIKQIQGALKNSGYYNGAIDGKLGRQTRKAITRFQESNGLAADGRVGRNTWKILGKYLYSQDGAGY